VKLLLLIAAGFVVAAAASMLWQQLRYLEKRRELAQDRQPLFYPAETFHVLTLLRVESGADVIEAVRALKRDTQGREGATWIYAGKVAVNALASAQLGEVEWSAVALVQYPSRAHYARAAAAESHRQALARFAQTYSHGLERPLAPNLVVYQLLLARRLRQLATFAPSHFPFEPAAEMPPEVARLDRLLEERELGARAAVVVNLVRRGNAEQRAADAAYVARMMEAMAEGGYGPLHIGRAVALEGGARFDSVAIAYYPGVEFFHAMVRSRYYQGIFGSKQLGDSQSSITVPILALL
jgi:hypothetical protein